MEISDRGLFEGAIPAFAWVEGETARNGQDDQLPNIFLEVSTYDI
jgi:hypothetical protein